MAKERLLTQVKRRVLRKHIGRGETVFGGAFVAILLLMAVWIGAQHDNFDPGDRDISFEVLAADSVEDTLYKAPLRPWVEPGTAVGGAMAPDLGLFPPSVLDGDWSVDGRLERYQPETLYQKINGAAEQYLSFGFEELSYLTIAQQSNLLTLEVYDQGRFENTLGLFAAQRSSGREVTVDGDVFFYQTPVGAVGGVGRYYFKLSGNSENDAVTAKAQQVVSILAGLGSATVSVPRGFSVLTSGLGIAFDKLSYKPTDAFQYDFASDFWFGVPSACADCRVFVHEAGDDGAAAELFAQLLEEQQFEYSLLDEAGDTATLQHEFLNTIFAVHRQGPLVYGVEGAPDRATARRLLGRLQEAVSRAQTQA